MSGTAGCIETRSQPAIPREERILDDSATIAAGDYQAWELTEQVRNASLHPVDESYMFSYEYTVETGSAVTLAVTDMAELRRREETDGQYKVLLGTRSHGRKGAKRERMETDNIDVLIGDTQHIGPETPPETRSSVTVHVQAYLSTPD